ncbi:MAG: FAD-dependent oxidoreductase [Pirellulaceae bacterium]
MIRPRSMNVDLRYRWRWSQRVVSLLGTLAEIARHTLRNDFRSINPVDARIILVEPSDYPLDVYPQPFRKACRQLKLGLSWRPTDRVVDMTPTEVVLSVKGVDENRTIRTRTVLWAAGVPPSSLAASILTQTEMAAARGGRVPVQADTSLAQHPNVFVLGDIASFNTMKMESFPDLLPWRPRWGIMRPVAFQADLQKSQRPSFRYRDRGAWRWSIQRLSA